jgi:hypothetical protein
MPRPRRCFEARYCSDPLRVAALRRSSREIVDSGTSQLLGDLAHPAVAGGQDRDLFALRDDR